MKSRNFFLNQFLKGINIFLFQMHYCIEIHQTIFTQKQLKAMRKKLKTKQVIIKDCVKTNDDFWKLFHIFTLTLCPGMRYEMFERYYKAKRLEYISVSFFYASQNEIVGFCAAAFYTSTIGEQSSAIARSATGFLENYQGKSLSKWKIYNKYMVYKIHHPFRKLILTIFAANPFVYNMVCKYTGIVYPRMGRPVPGEILEVKKEILAGSGLQKRESEPFVVKINFEVDKSEELKSKIARSDNVHVRFFVEKTKLEHCITLLLIIPVSWLNIFWCILLFAKHGSIKMMTSFKHYALAIFTGFKELPNLSVQNITTDKPDYANKQGM